MSERLQDGRYYRNTVDALVDALMEEAKAEFGEDLNDSQTAVIRMFYRPIAVRLAMMQEDIGLVLDSSQIEHAEGAALDFLTALIGVPRREAIPATGYVTIYMDEADSVSHTIPVGTRVGTNSFDATTYVTTQSATIEAGNTNVLVPIEAEEGGAGGNTGPNTITVFPSGEPFPGARVTNDEGTEGGRDGETDEELRERAQDELAEGARATAPALVSRVSRVPGVNNVNIFVNDTPDDNGRGFNLPSHAFEIVANGDFNDEDVAQMILDTKAAGDVAAHGVNGTDAGEIEADLPNHQTLPVGFSYAAEVPVYGTINIEVNDSYEGDEAVYRAIVQHVGGIMPDGQDENGRLRIGEDVIRNDIIRAVMGVDGVRDATHVEIGRSSGSTSTSNINLEPHEQAYTDASLHQEYINIVKTEV